MRARSPVPAEDHGSAPGNTGNVTAASLHETRGREALRKRAVLGRLIRLKNHFTNETLSTQMSKFTAEVAEGAISSAKIALGSSAIGLPQPVIRSDHGIV